jgi:hypothetical protein
MSNNYIFTSESVSEGHPDKVADQRSKMAATAGHRLTLDPMGKYSNAFFSLVVSEKKRFETFSP